MGPNFIINGVVYAYNFNRYIAIKTIEKTR